MNFILETVVLCAVVSFSAAQVTRPRINPQINLLSTFPGFPISNGTRESKVVIDVYLDLVCPDSASAFPVLQEVATAYPPEDLAVYIHQLPLPYHRNGFLLAQGYFQVVEKAPGMLQDYVTMCFNNISTFQGSTNKEKSEWEFTGILAKLQEGVTGIPSLQFVRDLPNYFGIAVSHWKCGVRKGVAGTPWFFVNDIDLGVNPNDEVDYNTWTILINILLRSHDMALPDQEINLDDYLHNNNDNSYNAQVKNLKFRPKQNNHHNNKDTNQNDQVKNLKFESKQNNLYSNIDDNNNTQGISNIVEQKPLVARQISRYLREIMQRNYFPVHSKLAINNARNSPTHKSQP